MCGWHFRRRELQFACSPSPRLDASVAYAASFDYALILGSLSLTKMEFIAKPCFFQQKEHVKPTL